MTGSADAPARRPQLTVLPLIALIFYDVSGGPFGIEDSVRAGGGALLPILGFLVLPVLWSLPEALVTAELASAFPTNAGYVAWVSAAFGPAAAFLVGFSKWASGTLDNALYPVLFLDYLRSGGGLALPPPLRSLAVLALTAALTYLNYRGLHLVGLSALALTAFSLSPFVAVAALAVPKICPAPWRSPSQDPHARRRGRGAQEDVPPTAAPSFPLPTARSSPCPTAPAELFLHCAREQRRQENSQAFLGKKILLPCVFSICCHFLLLAYTRDHAAGSIIVTEAGGIVTDAAGNDLDFSKGRFLDLDTGNTVSCS